MLPVRTLTLNLPLSAYNYAFQALLDQQPFNIQTNLTLTHPDDLLRFPSILSTSAPRRRVYLTLAGSLLEAVLLGHSVNPFFLQQLLHQPNPNSTSFSTAIEPFLHFHFPTSHPIPCNLPQFHTFLQTAQAFPFFLRTITPSKLC